MKLQGGRRKKRDGTKGNKPRKLTPLRMEETSVIEGLRDAAEERSRRGEGVHLETSTVGGKLQAGARK